MTSGYLSAELTATCNALGYYDGHTYHLEPFCSETAKDLIRYLRRDDDTHEIRRFFGHSKIVQTDLLPIIQCHSNNQELFDIALRLLVNLTNPAFLVYKEAIPKDKLVRNQYLELVSQLQSYKEAFTQHKPWDVIAEKLGVFLNTPDNLRDDDMRRNIERILILVRNVLHVPLSDGDVRPDNDASIHDQVLWALHQSGMLDLFLYIASSPQEEFFYMHIIEIICLMVREQPASLLAQAASTRSHEEKSRDNDELLAIRKRETVANQQKIRKYQGMRNFGGTYVIKNMKSTSEKDIIYHKPLQNLNKISLDNEKKKVKTPKNRQPLECFDVERRSALSVRLILKQFCIEILNAAYNPLMQSVKSSLVRGKNQDNDETYYFKAMHFFMEFNRNYRFQIKLVSETLSVESFHFIQKYLETWHEMMLTDKAKIDLWSSRMHFALKSYKELLYNLMEMDKNEDQGVKESSRVIKSNIFYVVEYREMLLMLMNSYKKPKFSLKYLCDLIETVHVFLKLLENFAQNKKLFVQKKVSKPRKKNNKRKKQAIEKNLEELWNTVSPELSAVLASTVNKEVFPFDAASDVPMDEQKIFAVKKLQNMLKCFDYETAVAYLRASREIWPENDTFGNKESTPEEELSCFKEVFMADLDLGFIQDEEVEAPLSEEEEDQYPPPIEERSFESSDFLKSFANPRVVYICGILLKTFETNSRMVNHCVAKMLHRISWDCKLPSMVFQATIFRSFQRILASHNPSHKELAGLAKFIVKKFVQVAATNKKLLIELLFWKSSKDAYDIEEGYGSYQEKSKSAKNIWEEHEEDELRRLYMEYKTNHPDKELTNDNVVPWITSNLIKERTERAVAKKLREMLLVVGKTKKKPLWTPEEEELLKTLFDEFRETDDPVGMILPRFPERSRRIIVNTLIRLGVVQDRSELKAKKKTRRKKVQNDSSSGRDDSNNSESSSDDEDDRINIDDERRKQREALERPSLYRSVLNLITMAPSKSYLAEGVEWLHEAIQDNLEDCDDDPAEVPLLPLSEAAIKSVDDKQFQNLLLSLGLFSPFQQQEMYWRFPSTWNIEEFSKRADLVNLIAEHCKDEFQNMSKQLKDTIVEKFGERLFEDNGNSSEEETNTAKDDFEAMVARHCQETLKEHSLSDPSSNNTQQNSLLYSKSDDEESKSFDSFKKKAKKKNTANDVAKKIKSNKDNSFLSKVKKMAMNKLKVDNFMQSDSESDESEKNSDKNNLNSESKSDKENDRAEEVFNNNISNRKTKFLSRINKALLDSDDSNDEIRTDKTDEDLQIIDYNVSEIGGKLMIDSDNSGDEATTNLKKKLINKTILSDESGDETNNENNIMDLNGESKNESSGVNKRTRILLDSDDENDETFTNLVNKKRHIIDTDED